MITPIYVQKNALHEICVTIIMRHGVNSDDAALVSEALIEANLRGCDSHGVIRLPLWMQGLNNRTINPSPRVGFVSEGTVTALVDGDCGLGPVVGEFARKVVADKAKKHGIAIVSVRHASHLGMLTFYAEKLAEDKLASIILTNTEPAMAPFGSAERILGTNPICLAAPSLPRPIIVDMSSSVVARGKLLVAQAKNSPIPETWALDKLGRPTTSAEEALNGALRPIADHKGSGLAIMIDLLSGALAGASVTKNVKGTYRMQDRSTKGDTFIAFDPDRLGGMEKFVELASQAANDVTSSKKAPGSKRIFMPGEVEYECKKERLVSGIPFSDTTFDELQKLLNSPTGHAR